LRIEAVLAPFFFQAIERRERRRAPSISPAAIAPSMGLSRTLSRVKAVDFYKKIPTCVCRVVLL
jgi:hypothetical protein